MKWCWLLTCVPATLLLIHHTHLGVLPEQHSLLPIRCLFRLGLQRVLLQVCTHLQEVHTQHDLAAIKPAGSIAAGNTHSSPHHSQPAATKPTVLALHATISSGSWQS